MSKRLSIAALLNPNDNQLIVPEPVVLAPHLLRQSSSADDHRRVPERYDPVHDVSNVRAKPPSPPPQEIDQWLAEQYEPASDHDHIDDPDVDQLVEETLGSPAKMQPDVEDELLSLVDDRPAKKQQPPQQSDVSATASQSKKRNKPGPKPKARTDAPPKPRAKPGPKPKPRDQDGNIIRPPPPIARKPSNKPSVAPSRAVSNTATATATGASRSRSTSVLPTGSAEPTEDPDPNPEEKEDDKDKLYCVCNTKYDEDRSMIACDKCDEWYHTQCVDIPDHQVDLIDQFFCPPCISKNPNVNLTTTYKTRCLSGLDCPDPESPKACHKPARPFSKYCSDECGVKALHKRIDDFTKIGGKKDDLWQVVKNAEKREGLVKCVNKDNNEEPIRPTKGIKQKEMDRLDRLLNDIQRMREELDRGMDIIMWREKLINMASDRAQSLEQCGWDQRLCLSDEDWADYGEGVLDSYGDQAMQVDEEGEWWCPGEQECERHAGWQNLRSKELVKEKERKEDALAKLTSKEREIRKHIEDILSDSNNRDSNETRSPEPPEPTATSALAKGKAVNGGDPPKKGKKRKAPS